MATLPTNQRRLCAHADADGEGMHWLNPGQACTATPTTNPTSDLDEAQELLAAAAAAIDGWRSQHSSDGGASVADGHEAIRLIDATMQQLHRVRGALIGAIRADEDERAARVDAILAEFRARQANDVVTR